MRKRNLLSCPAAMVAASALVLACSKSSEASVGWVATPMTAATPTPATPDRLTFQGETPVAPAPFEGEIVVRVTDEVPTKMPASITYDIKGEKVRSMPVSADVRVIEDLASQHALAISDKTHAYADFDENASKNAKPTEAKIQKTAKEEKVAGVDCEDWSIDAPSGKVDVCAAKGIGFFDLEPSPGSAEPTWAAALTKENAFPLRLIVHDKTGKEEYRAEATTVQRKPLDDAMFALPSGFKKADLGASVRVASLP